MGSTEINKNIVSISIVPMEKQRYKTLGDYIIYPNEEIVIKVSNTGINKYNLLIAVHELIEVLLTEDRGIKEPDIAKFDIKFEKERKDGKHEEWEEPGDSPDSPYRKEHRFAENIERQLAHELGINWNEYENYLLDYLTSYKPPIIVQNK